MEVGAQSIGLCSPRSGRLGDAPARAVGGSGGLLEGGAVQLAVQPCRHPGPGRAACAWWGLWGQCYRRLPSRARLCACRNWSRFRLRHWCAGGSVVCGLCSARIVVMGAAECLRWLPPGRWRSGSVEFAAVGEGTVSFGYGIVRLEDVSGWSRGTCHCCCLGGHGWAFRPEQQSALVAVCAGKVRR